MVTTTGLAIRQELQRYGLLRVLGQGTTTAAAANRLRDTLRLDATPLAGTKFDGCYLRVTVAGGASAGEQRGFRIRVIVGRV